MGLGVALFLTVAAPPLEPAWADGVLELQLEPAVVDVPEGAGRRHWRIATDPRPTVTASDETVRTMVQDEIDQALAKPHAWIADRGSAWSLLAQLAGGNSPLSAVSVRFPDTFGVVSGSTTRVTYMVPPGAAAVPVRLGIRFTYAVRRISAVRIEVSSAGAPAEPLAGVTAVKEFPATEDASTDDRIRIRLVAAGTVFVDREEERLRKVAREALAAAKAGGLLPTHLVPTDSARGLVARRIMASVTPSPRATVDIVQADVEGFVVVVVAVRDVLPIGSVRIDASYDLATLLAPGTTVSPHTRARLAERAADAAKDIEERFRDDLEQQIGTVLTHDEEAETLKRLREDPKKRVARVDTPTFADGVLTYPVVIKPTVKTLGGSAGIEYAPREGLNGTLGLTGQNLLGLGEDGSINVRGGPHSRRGDVGLNFPLTRWMDERLTPLVSLHGLYSRLDDVVYGRGADGVTEEEATAGVRTSIVFRPWAPVIEIEPGKSPTERRRALGSLSDSTALALELDVSRRDVHLDGVTVPAGLPKDGVTAPVSLTVRAMSSWDPGAPTNLRLRGVDVALESTFERSFEWLGSDHRYTRWDLRASMAATLAVTPEVDMVLRYVHGYGVANDGTPLFRFLRVGGESSVRGLEEGEFVARTLQFQQAEAGVSLCSAYRLISRRLSTGDEQGCRVENFDLSKVFAKLFVDHARIEERFEQGRLVAASRHVFGVGAAVELRDLPLGRQKVTLSIGYGYSPDSRKHERGTVFTQAIMPFGLR